MTVVAIFFASIALVLTFILIREFPSLNKIKDYFSTKDGKGIAKGIIGLVAFAVASIFIIFLLMLLSYEANAEDIEVELEAFDSLGRYPQYYFYLPITKYDVR